MCSPLSRLPSRLLKSRTGSLFVKPHTARLFNTSAVMASTGGALPHQTDPSAHAVAAEKATAGQPHQTYSNINVMTREKDGSYNRKASTFRNFITKDGEFTPEKGEEGLFDHTHGLRSCQYCQAATTSMSPTLAVSAIADRSQRGHSRYAQNSLGYTNTDRPEAERPRRLYRYAERPRNMRMDLRTHRVQGVTVVSPRMGDDGWPFANVDEFPGADVDPFNGAKHVKDLYFKASSNYSGRYASEIPLCIPVSLTSV